MSEIADSEAATHPRRPTPSACIAFGVDDIDATVAGLRARGTELLGDVVRHEDSHRLCYVRGPDRIIVMLAEQLG